MTDATRLLFECPQCGSHKFGTAAPGATALGLGADAVGHCHGDMGCRFTWNRDADDWEVFTLNGAAFASPKAHDAAVAQRAEVLGAAIQCASANGGPS